MFKASVCLVVDSNRVSLLAYSPLAMGLLSGKYLTPDGGPPDARLNLYRGCYAEAECRYSLSKPNVIPAISVLSHPFYLYQIKKYVAFFCVNSLVAQPHMKRIHYIKYFVLVMKSQAYMEIAQRHGISPVALAIGK
jgi:hypothetical protein